MNILNPKYLVLSAILLSASFVASAQALTPATYIEIELQIRQLTNDGMAQRLFLLRLQNEDSLEDQQTLDVETVSLVNNIFQSYGTSAGKHTAYGTQQTEAITEFLNSNPSINQQFESISAEFENLSSLIRAELEN